MRKTSGDEWKDESEREKKSTSCFGFGRMVDGFASESVMMLHQNETQDD